MMNSKLRDGIPVVFVLMLGLMGLMFMHEQVHVQIYGSYGIESHVEYFSNFPSIVTVPDENCPTEMCVFANNLNEIVGYPLLILYTVWAVLYLWRLE